jgi:hypothetical protein
MEFNELNDITPSNSNCFNNICEMNVMDVSKNLEYEFATVPYSALSTNNNQQTIDNDTNNLLSCKKYKRNIKELPFDPKHFSVKENYKDINITEETVSKDYGDDLVIGEKVFVASSATINGNTPFYLDGLTLQQLRHLARIFYVPHAHNLNKFMCRYNIAAAVMRRKVLDDTNVNKSHEAKNSGPTSNTSSSKRYNTIMRMINVLFSVDFLPQFLESNKNKSRYDFEIGVGGDMSRFWKNVSDELSNNIDVNDSDLESCNDPYNESIIENNEGKENIEKIFSMTDINLGDYLKETPEVLSSWAKDLVRVRAKIISNMTTSGTHENDLFQFVDRALLSLKKKHLLGFFPTYYFCLRANSCPDFDSRFSPLMSDEFKIDSSQLMYSETPVVTVSGGAKKRNRNNIEIDDLKESMQQILTQQDELNSQKLKESYYTQLEFIEKMLERTNENDNPDRYNKLKKELEQLEIKLFK